MRHILPHIVVILHMPVLTAVAFGLHEPSLVAYSGATVGLVEDPAVLVGAIILGLVASRWWHIVVAGLLIDMAIHLYVIATNDLAIGSSYVFFARASGLLTVAFAVNLLRLAIGALSKSPSATAS